MIILQHTESLPEQARPDMGFRVMDPFPKRRRFRLKLMSLAPTSYEHLNIYNEVSAGAVFVGALLRWLSQWCEFPIWTQQFRHLAVTQREMIHDDSQFGLLRCSLRIPRALGMVAKQWLIRFVE